MSLTQPDPITATDIARIFDVPEEEMVTAGPPSITEKRIEATRMYYGERAEAIASHFDSLLQP